MDGASIGPKEGLTHMRQQYTPIFAKVLASRLWALSPATRCVWLWLELRCDPEGYMCTDVAGVAIGAHVTGSEAREALEVLSLEDADADPQDPHQGRLIERVPGGWRVLGFEEARELAKAEGRRARARRYMATSRAAAKDMATKAANDIDAALLDAAHAIGFADGVDAVTPGVPSMTPPKPKPKPKPFSPEDRRESPEPPPAASLHEAQGARTVWRDLSGWTMTPGLRGEAVMAGVPAEDIDGYLVRLANGPIGGTRGVFDRDGYVRSMFGKWRLWSETERAKRPQGTKAPAEVKGMPPWVRQSHRDQLQQLGLELKTEAKRFATTHHIPPSCINQHDAAKAFTAFIARIAKEAA